jgi:hypothetical protein
MYNKQRDECDIDENIYQIHDKIDLQLVLFLFF